MVLIKSVKSVNEVKEDEQGRFPANCSVCFQDKLCVGVSYQPLIEICDKLQVQAHGFAVCVDCFKMDSGHLYKNLLDYFVMDELYRWLSGEKDGIVRSELEFKTLLCVAGELGILYREEKRMRHRSKQDRVINNGLLNVLKRQNTGDYNVNPLLRNMFKKLYEG